MLENTEKRAEAIGLAMKNFQNSLDIRKVLTEQATLNEVVKIDYVKVI